MENQASNSLEPTKDSPTPDKKESKQNPARVAICRVDQVFSKKDRKTHLVKSARSSDTGKFSKYAIVVRRIFNYKGEYEDTEIDIRGYHLRDTLREMYPDTEGMKLAENPPIATPDVLYHSRAELERRWEEAKAATTPNEDLIFDLAAALDFVKTSFGGELVTIDALLENGEITFEYLWALYRPCEPVFHIDGLGEPRVYIAKSHRTVKEPNGKFYYEILGDYLDSDGVTIGLASMDRILVPFFKGAKNITTLELFPLRYHPDRENLRTRLIQRGKMGLKLQGRQFKAYSGHAYKEVKQENPFDEDGYPKKPVYEKFNSHGRVIADPQVYENIEAANNMIPYIIKAYEPEDLEDEQLLTYSSMVYGFSLGDKIWGGFAIERMTDIVWDDRVFDSLVMAEPQKSLVHTLVRVHGLDRHGFDDFVAEKGKGLIGLLTGPPGVGKTLTAEAVAEVSRRPLYMITSAELGDKPSVISTKIAKILEVCQIWNAVLLLDEADIFLAKRDDSNLERNAVVSIFLRQMEYYRGILILTTNRVDSIDSAFQSRIHFRHAYPQLGKAARISIWKSFINLARSNKQDSVEINDAEIGDLAGYNLNGRQIKNTMSIAQTIAVEGGKPLSAEQVKLIIQLFQGSSQE